MPAAEPRQHARPMRPHGPTRHRNEVNQQRRRASTLAGIARGFDGRVARLLGLSVQVIAEDQKTETTLADEAWTQVGPTGSGGSSA